MNYSPGLDGLRAIAILSVMLFHANPDVLVGGYLGVDLFFVLSAFLITSILTEEYRRTGTIDLRRFYLRRLLRLAPALLFMLAVYMLFAPLAWPGEPHGRDALITGLYLSDFTVPAGIGPDHLAHSWSLAIEEQFYLLWPLLLVPLMRSKRALAYLLAAWLAVIAWRSSFADWRLFYFRPDTHGSGLLLGAGLALSQWRGSRRLGLAGAAIFACLTLLVESEKAAWAIVGAEIAAVLLIASAAELKWLETPWLVHIGKLSYGLYLWHFPIAHYLRGQFDFFTTAAIMLPLTYAMALLSYHSVEAWSRRIKARLERLQPAQLALPG